MNPIWIPASHIKFNRNLAENYQNLMINQPNAGFRRRRPVAARWKKWRHRRTAISSLASYLAETTTAASLFPLFLCPTVEITITLERYHEQIRWIFLQFWQNLIEKLPPDLPVLPLPSLSKVFCHCSGEIHR